MEEVVKKTTQEDLIYQRVKYRIHDTDDPALKEYYREFVKNYEATHPQKKTCSCSCKHHTLAALAQKQR